MPDCYYVRTCGGGKGVVIPYLGFLGCKIHRFWGSLIAEKDLFNKWHTKQYINLNYVATRVVR